MSYQKLLRILKIGASFFFLSENVNIDTQEKKNIVRLES